MFTTTLGCTQHTLGSQYSPRSVTRSTQRELIITTVHSSAGATPKWFCLDSLANGFTSVFRWGILECTPATVTGRRTAASLLGLHPSRLAAARCHGCDHARCACGIAARPSTRAAKGWAGHGSSKLLSPNPRPDTVHAGVTRGRPVSPCHWHARSGCREGARLIFAVLLVCLYVRRLCRSFFLGSIFTD